MRILVDCCLSTTWLPLLVTAGHEAFHWRDIGESDAADETLIAWATANKFAILTHDLDFGALISVGNLPGPSVLQVRAESHMPTIVGAHVLAAIRQHEKDLEQGAIVTVDGVRIRVRRLPQQ